MKDRSEYEDTFKRNYLRLVYSLMRRGAPLCVAEELAADVMTRLYKRWDEIESPENWVWATAHREFPTVMLKERQYVPLDEEPPEGGAAPSGAGCFADEVEDRDQWLRLLKSLPDRQRAVVGLYLDGLGTAEIGSALGISPSTVRSQFRNGKNTLAEMLRARQK
ncbi:RNA polymerase sigma factor [Frankia sp. CiP3]|uniref:RNA polymerase sigma factor n=1 Tax=Frankia sp. CiP3 TaxID=2880971 RepID=UPI001EF6118B|nr:sigma-70 family RNA polymerase sigma factor [Frankia sp. CiP3]